MSLSKGFEILPSGDDGIAQILVDGRPYLDLLRGGTGPCWNIREADDEEGTYLHVCDLAELIQALTVLLVSPEHQANLDRWG